MSACALASSHCTTHIHVCWHLPYSWARCLEHGFCPTEHPLITHCEEQAKSTFAHLLYYVMRFYPDAAREILYQQKLIVMYLSCATWLRSQLAVRCWSPRMPLLP